MSITRKALLPAEQLEEDETQLLTTRAIILEIGNAFSKQRYREASIELLESLEQDPKVEVVSLTEDL